MAAKTFCPIMTIGFDPPGEGKRDNRICMKDCTWYNIIEETCQLNVITATLQEIENHANDIGDYIADIAMEKTLEEDYNYGYSFEFDEKEKDYYDRFSK